MARIVPFRLTPPPSPPLSPLQEALVREKSIILVPEYLKTLEENNDFKAIKRGRKHTITFKGLKGYFDAVAGIMTEARRSGYVPDIQIASRCHLTPSPDFEIGSDPARRQALLAQLERVNELPPLLIEFERDPEVKRVNKGSDGYTFESVAYPYIAIPNKNFLYEHPHPGLRRGRLQWGSMSGAEIDGSPPVRGCYGRRGNSYWGSL